MKIYPKILLITLPLIVLPALLVSFVSYLSYRDAIETVALDALQIRLGRAVEICAENEALLHKYGLETMPANVAGAQADAAAAISAIRFGETGYLFAVDAQGIIQSHPNANLIGFDAAEEDWFREITRTAQTNTAAISNKTHYTWQGETRWAVFDHFTPWDWYIVSSSAESELLGAVNRLNLYTLLLLVTCLGLATGILLLLARRLTAPIYTLIAATEKIRQGKLETHIPLISGDEIGQLALAFLRMQGELKTLYENLESQVAELEQTEQALRQSERDLLEAQHIARIGNWSHNLVTDKVKWSDEMFRIAGYEPREVTIKWLNTLIHPDDMPHLQKTLALAQAGQHRTNLDLRIVRPDGEIRHIHDRWESFFDNEGNEIKRVGTIQDITERKQTEQALRQSEKVLLEAQHIARIGNWFHNLVTDKVKWSDEMFRIAGHKRREVTYDWLYTSLIHPDDIPHLQKALALARAGQRSTNLEFRIIRPDGEIRHVQNRWESFFDSKGNEIKQVGTVQDITERKLAEEEIRRRNRELEFLNQMGQILVSTLDLTQILADVMEETRRLLAVSGCSVWLLEPATNKLVCLQATTPHNRIMQGWKLAQEQGLVGWATHHGQSVLSGDTRAEPRHYPEIDRRIGVEMRSVISAPLRVRQKIIGGINVVDTAVNRFGATDLNLVESLATSLSIVIENGRLFEQEQQQRQAAEQALRETRLLYHISSILAQSSNMQTAVEQVLGEYLQALGLKQGGIALFDLQEQTSKLYALYQNGRHQTANLPIKIMSQVYDKLIQSQQPVAIVDAWNDPLLVANRDLTEQLQIKSILFVPLLVQGRVVGTLGADSTGQPRHFSKREIELGQAVAGQLAGAVDRIRLEEAQQRLTAVLEQATETIIITDLAGNIVYANPHFETSSGYSVAEALGQTPNILRSGRQGTAFYQKLWNSINAGETWHGVFINKRKDGRLYHEEAAIFPIKNAAGEIINYAAVKRDITERIRAEEQLRQSQKMEAVGQLAGGVAHDFNNILTAIIGYANLPLDLNLLPPEHPVRNDLQGIVKSANRAAELTRQLLTFARRQVVKPRTIDLNALIFDLDKMLRRLISENIELITLAGPQLGHIKADPGQIEQVLVNLVVNAKDAMPDGGKLTIETANVVLDKNYANQYTEVIPGEYVMLTVNDTGTGMSPEVQAHIFEPFYTTKNVGQGTGLGLATCFGIVKQAGGHIRVYSETGRGTTFKVYLPSVKEPLSPVSSRVLHRSLPRGTETILLVEDETAVRDLVTRVLREQGYTILEAANGEKALRLAEGNSRPEIDLLLTDVVMPLMGGKKLAEKLSDTHPQLKVLFISGYTDNAIIHNGTLEAGTSFLQKPFSPSTLAHKVREVLDIDVQTNILDP